MFYQKVKTQPAKWSLNVSFPSVSFNPRLISSSNIISQRENSACHLQSGNLLSSVSNKTGCLETLELFRPGLIIQVLSDGPYGEEYYKALLQLWFIPVEYGNRADGMLLTELLGQASWILIGAGGRGESFERWNLILSWYFCF